jgi:hypothetical protein
LSGPISKFVEVGKPRPRGKSYQQDDDRGGQRERDACDDNDAGFAKRAVLTGWSAAFLKEFKDKAGRDEAEKQYEGKDCRRHLRLF